MPSAVIDRHVALQRGIGAFIDVEQARLLASAGADDLHRLMFCKCIFLETRQLLQALPW